MSTAASELSVKEQVSEEEWETRVNLAACYRLIAMFGWDDLIFTHISARVPGPEHHFLINAYGLLFDEMTASSLVKVDLGGEIVQDSPYFINPAGFTIHSAVHAAREDAGEQEPEGDAACDGGGAVEHGEVEVGGLVGIGQQLGKGVDLGVGLIEQPLFLLAGREDFFGDIEGRKNGDVERRAIADRGGGLIHFLVEIGGGTADVLGVAPFAGAQLVGLFEDLYRDRFFLRHKSWENIKKYRNPQNNS